jgi:hypothetical protein
MDKRELQQQQQEQLMEAYERLSGKTLAEVRKNIYKSLTFFWLRRESPEGFTTAIHYGEEYVSNPRLLPSGEIWVNLASAYALKAKWLKEQSGSAGPDPELRQRVITAIREALHLDDSWLLRFQLLLQSDHPLKTGPDAQKYKIENDLQIFETDPEIRILIGLPPKRREEETPVQSPARSESPEPASSIPTSRPTAVAPPATAPKADS